MDADFPATPYPGARPDCSFVHEDGRGYPLTPAADSLSGWRLDTTDLDAWLTNRSAAPMAERVPLLAYGSNACPAKLTWLRARHGLTGPVVALRVRCAGIAAVWAAGLRIVDDQRPAVLAAVEGALEEHVVIMATTDQLHAFDACEGRGDRYHLATVKAAVTVEGGGVWDHVLAYVGAREIRRPLLVHGAPVPCAALPQQDALHLVGTPAPDDGLQATPITETPDPTEFPQAVFVYGTLQPGASAWHLLAPHAAGPAKPATLTGSLYDTGQGYPGLVLGTGPGVSGWSVPLNSKKALAELDEYEGPEYARVRVVLADGTIAWAYVWLPSTAGMALLREPWPVSDSIG